MLKAIITQDTNRYIGPPDVICAFDPGDISSLKQPGFKYASLHYAYDSCDPLVKRIIDSFVLVREYKSVLLDVKYLYLEPGWASCLLGWHIDCVRDLSHESTPEVHHLWFSGCDANTKFICEPTNNVSDSLCAWIAPEKHYLRYSRFHLHSATEAKTPGWRLIVRVTETDLITPNNSVKEFKPNKNKQKLIF